MRLTKEHEELIQNTVRKDVLMDIDALVGEIDELRAEQVLIMKDRDAAITNHYEMEKHLFDMIKERDVLTRELNALKAEHKKLQEFYDTHVMDTLENDYKDDTPFKTENKELKASNAKLLSQTDGETDWHAIAIKAEERIEKLRESLTYIGAWIKYDFDIDDIEDLGEKINNIRLADDELERGGQ